MSLRILMNYGRNATLHPVQAGEGQAMGGIRTAVAALCQTLARRGHDVHLFARCPSPGVYQGVTWHDRAEFGRFAETETVDVLVAIPEVLPLLMPLRARARVVWSGNAFQAGDCALAAPYSWAPHIGAAGETARLYSMALLHPYADRIVVKSVWQARYMHAMLGIPSHTFAVAYNGVPLQYYQGAQQARHRHRLVYTSQARRGLEVLLSVFPHIRAAVPETELHVFGYEYATAANLPDLPGTRQPGVVWRGRLSKEDLAGELRVAGVMAYPCTLKETFCTAVAEAQAAGLPVVTSNRAALAERVDDGVDGFLIDGRPAEGAYQDAFCAAVVRLLREDDLWRQMGSAAARKAHRVYDWDVIASGWEDDLTRLVAGREPLPPRHNPALDLSNPAVLTVSDRGASAQVPPALAARWLQDAWASYGYDPATIPFPPSAVTSSGDRTYV